MKEITFKGNPCAQCGNEIRYVVQNRCVACKKKYDKKYIRSEKGKNTAKKKNRKQLDLRWYGARIDNEKTQRRRDAEERLLNKELGLC
jgi:hypothetical protein